MIGNKHRYLLAIAHRELANGVRPRIDAADVVQDAYLQAVRRGTLDQIGWLVIAVRHKAINACRRHFHQRRDVRRHRDVDLRREFYHPPGRDADPLFICMFQEGMAIIKKRRRAFGNTSVNGERMRLLRAWQAMGEFV